MVVVILVDIAPLTFPFKATTPTLPDDDELTLAAAGGDLWFLRRYLQLLDVDWLDQLSSIMNDTVRNEWSHLVIQELARRLPITLPKARLGWCNAKAQTYHEQKCVTLRELRSGIAYRGKYSGLLPILARHEEDTPIERRRWLYEACRFHDLHFIVAVIQTLRHQDRSLDKALTRIYIRYRIADEPKRAYAWEVLTMLVERGARRLDSVYQLAIKHHDDTTQKLCRDLASKYQIELA